MPGAHASGPLAEVDLGSVEDAALAVELTEPVVVPRDVAVAGGAALRTHPPAVTVPATTDAVPAATATESGVTVPVAVATVPSGPVTRGRVVRRRGRVVQGGHRRQAHARAGDGAGLRDPCDEGGRRGGTQDRGDGHSTNHCGDSLCARPVRGTGGYGRPFLASHQRHVSPTEYLTTRPRRYSSSALDTKNG